MEWTNKNPTEIGFYWVYLAHRKRLAMMEVRQSITGLFMRESGGIGTGTPVPGNEITIESTFWMGPLPIPELPKYKSPERPKHDCCWPSAPEDVAQ